MINTFALLTYTAMAQSQDTGKATDSSQVKVISTMVPANDEDTKELD